MQYKHTTTTPADRLCPLLDTRVRRPRHTPPPPSRRPAAPVILSGAGIVLAIASLLLLLAMTGR